MRIGVKAMCFFYHNGRYLFINAVDPSNNAPFYRLLGGSVEFGESSQEAIRREIREETGSEIRDLAPLGVVENHFEYDGARGHEIVFLFTGRFEKIELCEKSSVAIQDSSGEWIAEWCTVEELRTKKALLCPPFDYESLCNRFQ